MDVRIFGVNEDTFISMCVTEEDSCMIHIIPYSMYCVLVHLVFFLLNVFMKLLYLHA